MGIHGLENLTGAAEGYVIHVTEHNHDWVSEVSGLSLEAVAVLYARSVERGVVCTLNVKDKPLQPDVTSGTVIFTVYCSTCGERFDSHDGYGAAREMRDAHAKADH